MVRIMSSFSILGVLATTALSVACLAACSTTTRHTIETIPTPATYNASSGMSRGYQYSEAKDFIEFCVDLDSQDDRQAHPDDPLYTPQYDPKVWKTVYDSRDHVARDLVTHRDDPQDPWHKLYQETGDRWRNDLASHQLYMPAWDEQQLSQDPRYNGFGHYQTAWVLYQNQTVVPPAPPIYAIAIRGTVLSSQPSAVEDILFHPVLAQHFLNDDVSFASYQGASVHSGFAFATFTLLFDERYGILQALRQYQVPDGARLYIVGHSQGAAMATLVQAFLHYAGTTQAATGATATGDPFGLDSKHFALKSYTFAQPKPGNFYFAADFARYTQAADSAIVINNDIDPVPQVPLTLQDLGDIEDYLPGASFGANLLRYISGIGSGLRGTIGRAAEPFVKHADSGYGLFLPDDSPTTHNTDRTGSSWNFVAAGHVLLVFGTPQTLCGTGCDQFIQHHAWMYRDLIKAQLGAN